MLRSEKHRRFVANHRCVVCSRGFLGRDPDPTLAISQACHVNYLGATHGRARGKGEKVDDIWVIPMCPRHHMAQSADGQSGIAEHTWWLNTSINPQPICLELARNSPDPKVREFADAL